MRVNCSPCIIQIGEAFGVRAFGTALVVFLILRVFGTTDAMELTPIITAMAKWTTKSVPSYRTPKAAPILNNAYASINLTGRVTGRVTLKIYWER